jgi:hypothetical protein
MATITTFETNTGILAPTTRTLAITALLALAASLTAWLG